MDRFIAGFPAEADGDLMLCRGHGVAYQKDQGHLVEYDGAYFEKYRGYEGQPIALDINAGRVALVAKFIGRGRMVDVGIGSGEFIKNRPNTFGTDVNPHAIAWLKRQKLLAERLFDFSAFSFWDVIEHIPTPEESFRHVPLHGRLFTSIPLFADLDSIRRSKHYRPDEHLYYFTEDGFLAWMELHGFHMLERQTFEIDAGREDIFSFAFRRYRWPRAPECGENPGQR
jgi:hypothetical protein